MSCGFSGQSNPFSSRYVRPGAIPFFFPEGCSVELLLQRLRDHGWQGQILGPHGSGKSALLAHLLPAIEHAGRPTLLYTLHEGARQLPNPLPSPAPENQTLVVLIDGYEQLSRWHRFRLRRLCRQAQWGLVVTAHRSLGFPTLMRLRPDVQLAQKIVHWLLRDSPSLISPEQVAAAFQAQHGDLREMLFALYDLWEQLTRQDPPTTQSIDLTPKALGLDASAC
ncbi:MAG: hypothetical protein NZ602_10230 [Thermoguttaceae bacterium]|nr:hypothetical protein [Thermoguttaceae bacterium]MDW8037854.1 hypothetical protein [Thermoguttaceae bacterium]